jgi:hypothetical protein
MQASKHRRSIRQARLICSKPVHFPLVADLLRGLARIPVWREQLEPELNTVAATAARRAASVGVRQYRVGSRTAKLPHVGTVL